MKILCTIPKRLTNGKELVVVPKDEYLRLIKHNAEVKHALKIIAEGEKEFKEGKTRAIKSLAELR